MISNTNTTPHLIWIWYSYLLKLRIYCLWYSDLCCFFLKAMSQSKNSITSKAFPESEMACKKRPGTVCRDPISLYLGFTSLHFTSLRFASLHFTSLHFTSLHFTSLHFTSNVYMPIPVYVFSPYQFLSYTQAATQFKTSLNNLMTILLCKQPSYVRCIKPNNLKRQGKSYWMMEQIVMEMCVHGNNVLLRCTCKTLNSSSSLFLQLILMTC